MSRIDCVNDWFTQRKLWFVELKVIMNTLKEQKKYIASCTYVAYQCHAKWIKNTLTENNTKSSSSSFVLPSLCVCLEKGDRI